MHSQSSSALTELRRGVVEYCVLALLEQRDRYGFELVRTLADLGGLVTSQGTVYPLLSRLHQSGLVGTSWRPGRGERPRKYYSLTPGGSAALGRFREDWRGFRALVDHVLFDSESDS